MNFLTFLQQPGLSKYFKYLDGKEQSILRRHLRRKVNYLSGTMCPGNRYKGELESLEWVLNYYKDCGLEYVCLQPKFMGSRVQVYLERRDIIYSKVISRNGFLVNIKKHSLQPAIEDLHKKVFAKLDASRVIVDAELMPWSTLSQGLIERDFLSVFEGYRQEGSALAESQFLSVFQELYKDSREFREDFPLKSTKELKQKYGINYKTYKTVVEHNPYMLFGPGSLHKYFGQVSAYSEEAKPWFEPFAILKADDRVFPFDSASSYKLLNKNPIAVLDLTRKDVSKEVQKLFNCWVAHPEWFSVSALEGVVIKPLDPKRFDVSPYFKVRNPEYLRMVYGPFYDEGVEYNAVYANKDIKYKLKLSIKEYELGLKMLEFHQEEIQEENVDFANLLVDFFRSERQLRDVDPRL